MLEARLDGQPDGARVVRAIITQGTSIHPVFVRQGAGAARRRGWSQRGAARSVFAPGAGASPVPSHPSRLSHPVPRCPTCLSLGPSSAPLRSAAPAPRALSGRARPGRASRASAPLGSAARGGILALLSLTHSPGHRQLPALGKLGNKKSLPFEHWSGWGSGFWCSSKRFGGSAVSAAPALLSGKAKGSRTKRLVA